MRIEIVPIEKIKIGHRHRLDSGDIKGLAANIHEVGLLQPIGVDRFYQLIFGYRRLEACKDLLQWSELPCVILDIDSLLAGEYAENEFRKQFTPSERAAIGEAIEKELLAKGRKPGPKSSAIADDLPVARSVDLAANRAGFKSAESFERAKTVTLKGSTELITAMDRGDLSIDAAAKIATQPKAEQKRIVQMPKDEQRAIVKRIRKTKADKEADERRAYDLRVFRGLAEAVECIALFHEDAKATWDGLSRVSAYRFPEHLDRAITCLIRLQKEHPNASKKPGIVAKAAK
jgi:ParB-like chromosome segregation protein Spo0J